MAQENVVIRFDDVSFAYNDTKIILDEADFSVRRNSIITIIGQNGAGKSTTLKAISGLLNHEDGKVTDGSIEFMGERIDKMKAEKIAKMGIVQVIEGRKVFEHLTVEENLKVGAHMKKKNGRNIKDSLEMVYHYFPRLKEKRTETAGFISGGEQQMTVVGRALMTTPKLILLDEPSMGLAPLLIHEIFDIITRLNKEEGISILLVEQNAKLALSIAPYAYVMENGRVVMDDTSEKLRENPDIKDFYLGLTDVGGRKSFRDVKHYKRRKRWIT